MAARLVTRQLRLWQREAVDAVRAEWDAGINRTAVVAATGLGKSSVIGKLAVDEARAGGRVLLLAHREELLTQLTTACHAFDPTVPVGRVQAAQHQARRPITVASVATVRNETRQSRMIRPTLVVVDECHRVLAPGHLKVLAWAGSFDGTRTLGTTATMVRGDGKGLGDCWQSVALSRDIKFGIDEGLLVKPRGRVVVTEHMDLENAKVSRGDYIDADLGDMVSQSTEEIANAWRKHAEERITVAFVPTVDSAHELRDAFLAQGVAAEAVTGSTPTREREAMYARLTAGRTRVLVNVFVLVEGWDCPPVSCILMARPTRLPAVYVQAVGRGLRPYPAKDSCLVLDVVGASRHQRLVTLIDLHETAEYDTSDLDLLPCKECGEAPCACPPLEGAIEREGRPRLIGPVEYQDLDFFQESQLNWLFTHAGTRFLPAGERLVVLWPAPDGDDLYHAASRTTKGYEAGRYVGAGWIPDPGGAFPLDQARQRAERVALHLDASLASRGSPWRRGSPASEKQINWARGLGIPSPELMNKARLSDEISIAIASHVLDTL